MMKTAKTEVTSGWKRNMWADNIYICFLIGLVCMLIGVLLGMLGGHDIGRKQGMEDVASGRIRLVPSTNIISEVTWKIK